MDITKVDIRKAIDEGDLESALSLVNDALRKEPEDAELLYLRGNVFLKKGSWHDALGSFLESEHIDPQGPAREAREMLDEIMNFYNKDLYNP